jgi:hypothetical protein
MNNLDLGIPDRIGGAELSPCGLYRYRLWRGWNDRLPIALWIMLNPSTADAEADDPTIRRVMGLSKFLSAGSIMIVNLFAYRATNPANLDDTADPIGPDNDKIIKKELNRDSIIVAGWGSFAGAMHPKRVDDMLNLIGDRVIWSFGITKDGHPRHPLYLPGDAPFKIWRSPRETDMKYLSWFAEGRV